MKSLEFYLGPALVLLMEFFTVKTACLSLVANAFHILVLVCCKAYNFHERAQLDSIYFNELGM